MEDYSAFQSAVVVVAVLSCGCMLYTGFHSESRFDNKGFGTPSSSTTEPGDDKASGQPALSFASVVSMTCQILSDRNFQLFVLMNFFQVFMLAFFNNFTMIFTEHLIPLNVLPPLAKSVMYGAGFICPQVTSATSNFFQCTSASASIPFIITQSTSAHYVNVPANLCTLHNAVSIVAMNH